ncbi:related to toxD protein [Phialocephala subalpina]|uniref:Related to toxD protein n=1 Tax=Phialocephala subalpina TaxID=576137 RepID=A0A1L7XPZ9_9HELO|nr:related to toxD protein [Phialocephala subalpina]
MSAVLNIALWVDQDCAVSIVRKERREREQELDAGEVLVQTLYSGINPADLKHATMLGIRPAVLGYDFCGRVLKTQPGSLFTVGDIVAGSTPSGLGRPPKYGAHQAYLVCPEDRAFRVPTHVPHPDAACIVAVARTAADAIFNLFGYPLPTNSTDASTDAPTAPIGPLLIWGASTSVGVCALQYAHAIGATPIFVTASPTRFSELRELGATHCFDYRSPNVVADIRVAIDEACRGPVAHAFDAAGSFEKPTSFDLLQQCVSADARLVSVVLQPNSRCKLPLAYTDVAFRIQPPGEPVLTISPRIDDSRRSARALEWALENYGREGGFKIPHVNVVGYAADKALAAVQRVAAHGAGFEKLVIQHPLVE